MRPPRICSRRNQSSLTLSLVFLALHLGLAGGHISGQEEQAQQGEESEEARELEGALDESSPAVPTESRSQPDAAQALSVAALAAKAPAHVDPGRAAPARYHTRADMEDLLARWTANGLAERLQMGESAGGLPLLGIVLAAPGPIPARERKTFLIVGGLDGFSCAGTEAAVRVIEEILGATERLAPDIAVVVVPWANPDGLAATLAGQASGRNGKPVDDDLDGRVDEDGPDDVDGDGVILSMLVEDPEGPLARAQDTRFLRPATSKDRERWRLVPEGRDDDGDGKFNEDGVGGQRLDADFPLGWTPSLETGTAPLSQPESQALAALVKSRPVAVAIFLEGNHGGLAIPGGTREVREWLAPSLKQDEAAWQTLGQILRSAGKPLSPVSLGATAGERPGHPVDWLYASHGVLAMEWALWGPGTGRSLSASDAQNKSVDAGATVPTPDLLGSGGTNGSSVDKSLASFVGGRLAGPLGGEETQKQPWVRWLDDTRGGIGFVDWLPVELGTNQRALVGGWEPRTWVNPPEDLLPAAVASVGTGVLELLESLPRLALEVGSIVRAGGVVEVTLRVRNNGRLPSGVGPLGANGRGGLALELVLPEGAALLAGEKLIQIGHLQAGAASASVTWLLSAKDHSILQVALVSTWGGRRLKEVRL